MCVATGITRVGTPRSWVLHVVVTDSTLTSPQLEQFKGLPVIGGKQCEAVTKTPKDGETFKIGEGITVKALYTPCHTQDSICWYMQDGSEKVVFTGDTLFIGGVLRAYTLWLI